MGRPAAYIKIKVKTMNKASHIMLNLKKLYFCHVKPYLPPAVHKAILVVFRSVNSLPGWLRVQSPVTRVLGPEYRRNRNVVEIDITYVCNLRCYNCDRSCGQAPTAEQMTIEQVKQFVDETIAAKHRWERIRILGGEPTLHPHLLIIIEILRNWRAAYSPHTSIEIVTNGFGDSDRVTAGIPDDIIISNSGKKGSVQPFVSFNLAPVDLPAYRWADYRNGCYVTSVCGIGFTPNGWYPCAVAGGIDRIFGFGIGRDKLPEQDDYMEEQLKKLCCYCGHFKRRKIIWDNQQAMSKVWEAAYRDYRKKHSQPLSN